MSLGLDMKWAGVAKFFGPTELFELKLFSLNRRSGREVYLKSKILKLNT